MIGIDPGKTGAIAMVAHDLSYAQAIDYPGDPFSCVKEIELLQKMMGGHGYMAAFIETAQAMPKQGVTSMFSYGKNYGEWRGILAALKISSHEVRPKAWQKAVFDGAKQSGMSTKERSLEQARRMFPWVDLHRKGDHGKADALLIAVYGINKIFKSGSV